MTDGVSVVEEMVRRWGGGDQAGAFELISPAVVLAQPESLPWGGPHVGHEGMQKMFALMYAELDQDMGPMTMVGAGSEVVTRQQVTWTNRATGRSIAVPRLEIVTVEGGQATHFDVYLKDVSALLSIL